MSIDLPTYITHDNADNNAKLAPGKAIAYRLPNGTAWMVVCDDVGIIHRSRLTHMDRSTH